MSNEPNKKTYTPPVSPYQASQWIESLKQLYKIIFFAIIILGFIACVKLCSDGYVGLGLMILAVSLFTGLLAVGFVIVFLDVASDIRDMINYVYQIGSMIEDDKKRDISGEIEAASENIYQIKTILENNSTKKE